MVDQLTAFQFVYCRYFSVPKNGASNDNARIDRETLNTKL